MPKLSQDELLEIFETLKKELKPYAKGNMKVRSDSDRCYDLWSEKKGMFVYDRPRDEVAFASIMIQGGYVGFYFMPVYGPDGEKMKKVLAPELLKMLRGKACFHIKTTDKETVKHVKTALKLGYEAYKQLGWL